MLAGIYARQSVEKTDSVSIQAQIDSCRLICNVRKWEFEIFSDAGYSGGSMKRPAFEALLQAVRAGRIQAVVSYRLDRISRSISDFAKLLSLFEHCRIQYLSVTEQFDTSSPAGRAMIYMIMVFAQLERETIVQRVEDNYRFRAAMGIYMGGGVPYGYKVKELAVDGKKLRALEINRPESKTVGRIYSLYLGGFCARRIAEELSTAEKPFTAGAVLRILKSMTYLRATQEAYEYLSGKGYRMACGKSSFDGRTGVSCLMKTRKKKNTPPDEQVVAVGLHPWLVDSAEWIAVQKKLRRAASSPRNRGSSVFWLAGLVRCGSCGGRFGIKTTAKGGRVYGYFQCRSCFSRAKSCENDVRFNAEALEAAVWETMLGRAAKLLSAIPSRSAEFEGTGLTQAKLMKMKNELRLLTDRIEKMRFPDRYISEMIQTLDSEYTQLEEKARHSQLPGPAENPEESGSRIVADALRNASVSSKAKLARALIGEVRAFSDGTVTVRFKI